MGCRLDIPNPEYPIGTRGTFVYSFSEDDDDIERVHADWWLEDRLRAEAQENPGYSSMTYCNHTWIMTQIQIHQDGGGRNGVRI